MNEPSVLIISDSLDFASDYVSICLERKNVSYLRLNRDQLPDCDVTLHATPSPRLEVCVADSVFDFSNRTLRSVLYRAPVALRDIYQPETTMEDQLARTQWMAFIKNLMAFDSPSWINHPSRTYVAENKFYQINLAKSVGFKVPETIVTNNSKDIPLRAELLAVKSLDVTLLSDHDNERFLYTTVVSKEELCRNDLSLAPVIVQEYLEDKIDIRVTLVDDDLFAASITNSGYGVAGDWRTMKDRVRYEPISLPASVVENCHAIQKQLGLRFGALDLAYSKNNFYFLEINPTGEWAWLVDGCKMPIDESIARALSS